MSVYPSVIKFNEPKGVSGIQLVSKSFVRDIVKGEDIVAPNEIKVRFNFPWEGDRIITFRSDRPMTRSDVIVSIYKTFKLLYADEDMTNPESCAHLGISQIIINRIELVGGIYEMAIST